MNQRIGDLNIRLELTREKLKLLDAFEELTRVQMKLIESEDMDKLEALIKNKESIIDRINRVDSRLKHCSISVENNDKIEVLKESLNRKIEKIIAMDEKNKNLMKEKSSGVKSKLQNLKKGKKATLGYYHKPVQTHGYFIDKRK